MNVMLSQNGENFVVELSIDEGMDLHSVLEFTQRHTPMRDRCAPSEIKLATKMANELEHYLEDTMYEVINNDDE